MSYTQKQTETAEAVCSALYQMPFAEFLGENEVADFGRTAWFHLGEKPKDTRVAVSQPHNDARVSLRIEWVNRHGPDPLLGSQSMWIDASAVVQPTDLRQATEAALLRVLEVHKQVVAETGVAGQIDKLQETSDDGD